MDFGVAERRHVPSLTVDCSSGSEVHRGKSIVSGANKEARGSLFVACSHKGKIFCGRSRDRDSLLSRDLLNAELTNGSSKEIVKD